MRYGAPDTRKRILDAAWDMIEAGEDLTMAAVATRAGVSRQAVYLHVGDHSGLLVALVEHMDTRLGVAASLRHAFDAPTGIEALERVIAHLADFHAEIIPVARVIDGARTTDPAAAAAWDSRMEQRREGHRRLIQRIADERDLADGWDVDTAAALTHALTLPRVWDELVVELGWTHEHYTRYVTALIRNGLIDQRRAEDG